MAFRPIQLPALCGGCGTSTVHARPTSFGSAIGYPCIWEGATDKTSNNSVTPLINALLVAGFPPEGITKRVSKGNNSFGPKVTAAVRKFQQAKGILVDGVVGAGTWKKLNEAAPDEIDNAYLIVMDKCPPGAGKHPFGQEPENEPIYQPPATDGGGAGASGGGSSGGEVTTTNQPPPSEKKKLTEQVWFWPAVAGLGTVVVAVGFVYLPKMLKKSA